MAKKLKEKITLRHLKPYYIETLGFNPFENLETTKFYVLFENGKYEFAWGKDELIYIVERRAKDIKYIFDSTDRIILEKGVDIKFDEGDNKDGNQSN